MAWTYTTLLQAIQDYVQSDEDTFVANIPIIVQQAEDRILKNAQLSAFRKNVTGALTLNDEYLCVPDDFLAPYSLALDDSGYEYLLFKKVSYIREAYPDSTVTGTPAVYARFTDGYFIVGPTPDANFDVELHYFYKPDSIVISNTSWLGTHAESTLFAGCLLEAYIFLKGDADLLATYETRYKEALEQLKILGEGRNATDEYRNG
jgi:hypothetical protein